MKTCTMDGCQTPARKRGWCTKHYARWRRLGDASDAALTRHEQPDECIVDGCSRVPVARGWCPTHYDRWSTHGDPLHGGEVHSQVVGDDRRRFWSKVDAQGPDDCWEWRGPRLPKGYGYLTVGGRHVYAHRLAFEWATGARPQVVRHSCDNPPCVNPSHLLAGSVSDNIADKLERGRQPAGESVATAKLTTTAVDQIRHLVAAGLSDARIAAVYAVHRQSIANIRTGKTWREPRR